MFVHFQCYSYIVMHILLRLNALNEWKSFTRERGTLSVMSEEKKAHISRSVQWVQVIVYIRLFALLVDFFIIRPECGSTSGDHNVSTCRSRIIGTSIVLRFSKEPEMRRYSLILLFSQMMRAVDYLKLITSLRREETVANNQWLKVYINGELLDEPYLSETADR